jgi:hypothetical protein
MAEKYIDAVHIVAKLMAESSYHHDMSGGMGHRMDAEPDEILSKIYHVSRKKVRKQLNEVYERYLKRMYRRKR